MALDISAPAEAVPSGIPRIVELPRIPDGRGSLTYVESLQHIPFAARRVYWLYDVPGGAIRGGHAYRTLHEFIIALSGSFDVSVTDGINEWTFTLNRSYLGVHVPSMTWRELQNFSTNSVCLILASAHYDEDDYIRDYSRFASERGLLD